jgi:hypothetical protein
MEITVKEFIDLLQKEEPSRKLVFSGLDFYRLKDRDAFVPLPNPFVWFYEQFSLRN